MSITAEVITPQSQTHHLSNGVGVINPQQQELNITDKSVLISITLRRPGTKKKVDSGQIETDADRELISVSKKILDCPEFEAIKEFDHEIRNTIKRICLPSPFKAGIYLLPNSLILSMDEKLTEQSGRREFLVEEFICVYEDAVAEAERRLCSLFDASDYPPEDAVREAFSMSWQYLSFATPKSLKAISPEMFKREQERFQQEIIAATDSVKGLLRTQIKMLVDRAADRLKEGKDGKPRIFRDTLISNITEFLSTFDARNIADDQDLARVIAQMKDLATGLNPSDLRDDAELRQEVQGMFAGFAKEIDGMVIDKPIRKIRLDDEED